MLKKNFFTQLIFILLGLIRSSNVEENVKENEGNDQLKLYKDETTISDTTFNLNISADSAEKSLHRRSIETDTRCEQSFSQIETDSSENEYKNKTTDPLILDENHFSNSEIPKSGHVDSQICINNKEEEYDTSQTRINIMKQSLVLRKLIDDAIKDLGSPCDKQTQLEPSDMRTTEEVGLNRVIDSNSQKIIEEQIEEAMNDIPNIVINKGKSEVKNSKKRRIKYKPFIY